MTRGALGPGAGAPCAGTPASSRLSPKDCRIRMSAPRAAVMSVMAGTVASVMTHAYVRGNGGLKYVSPRNSML